MIDANADSLQRMLLELAAMLRRQVGLSRIDRRCEQIRWLEAMATDSVVMATIAALREAGFLQGD